MELTLDKTPYKIGRSGKTYLAIADPKKTASTRASGFSSKQILQEETKQTTATKADRIYRDFSADFMPYPIKPDRNCVYISGPSGAGKSYLAAQFIKEYIRKYPKNNVFIFVSICRFFHAGGCDYFFTIFRFLATAWCRCRINTSKTVYPLNIFVKCLVSSHCLVIIVLL